MRSLNSSARAFIFMCGAWLAAALPNVVCTSPAVAASQSVSRPHDWFDTDRRKIHILYVSPDGRRIERVLSTPNRTRRSWKIPGSRWWSYTARTTTVTSTRNRGPDGSIPETCSVRCWPIARSVESGLIAYYSVAFDNYASGIYPSGCGLERTGNIGSLDSHAPICLNSP